MLDVSLQLLQLPPERRSGRDLAGMQLMDGLLRHLVGPDRLAGFGESPEDRGGAGATGVDGPRWLARFASRVGLIRAVYTRWLCAGRR